MVLFFSAYRATAGGPVQSASYYSYDLMGNVRNLWQQVPGLGIKRIDYEYDLASGKVNFVSYQAGSVDQFFPQYAYDVENRLTEVRTGINTLLQPQDAKKMESTYSIYSQENPFITVTLNASTDFTGKQYWMHTSSLTWNSSGTLQVNGWMNTIIEDPMNPLIILLRQNGE